MPSIAIIGASANKEKYGNKAVRAYLRKGWTVYPINPRESKIEGITCFASVLEIPEKIEYASFYVPPTIGLELLEELAEKEIPKVFLNPGAESPELVQRAKKLGIEPMVTCSIRAIGEDPGQL